MIKFLIKIISLFLFLNSCGYQKTDTNTSNISPNTHSNKTTNKKIEHIKFTDTDFNNIDLLSDFEISKIRKPIGKPSFMNLLTVQNLHDTSQIDTIIRLRSAENRIEYYNTKYKSLIRSINITDNSLLVYKFRVGMTRNEFNKALNKKYTKVNEFHITSLENTEKWVFILKSDTLNQIYYNGYID
tara:strand:+ start:5944 stop:6498 length:555 start_codon:yes stop_codon:yes gene_type:complete